MYLLDQTNAIRCVMWKLRSSYCFSTTVVNQYPRSHSANILQNLQSSLFLCNHMVLPKSSGICLGRIAAEARNPHYLEGSSLSK